MKYIDEDMNENEMIECLSGNIKNSYDLLQSLTILEKFYLILKELDYFDIIGSRIYKLYEICNENIYDFDEALMLFRFGAFTKEEILENIESDKPVSFLDKSIIYGSKNDIFDNNKMKEYISALRMSFYEKKQFNTVLELKK